MGNSPILFVFGAIGIIMAFAPIWMAYYGAIKTLNFCSKELSPAELYYRKLVKKRRKKE